MYFPGVVWQISYPIEGGFESLAILQKLGKEIYLVTNNSENTDQTYCDRARCACLNLNPVSMQYLFCILSVYLKIILCTCTWNLYQQIFLSYYEFLFKKTTYDLHNY